MHILSPSPFRGGANSSGRVFPVYERQTRFVFRRLLFSLRISAVATPLFSQAALPEYSPPLFARPRRGYPFLVGGGAADLAFSLPPFFSGGENLPPKTCGRDSFFQAVN